MTLVIQRIAALLGEQVYIEVRWDSPMWDDDAGTAGDPGATYIIDQVIYQNLTDTVRHASVGGRVYDIPANTPRTVRNLTNPQQTRLDSAPSVHLY